MISFKGLQGLSYIIILFFYIHILYVAKNTFYFLSTVFQTSVGENHPQNILLYHYL